MDKIISILKVLKDVVQDQDRQIKDLQERLKNVENLLLLMNGDNYDNGK